MSYGDTLEKVIVRLDGEEKEKDRRIAELEAINQVQVQLMSAMTEYYEDDKGTAFSSHNLEQQAKGLEDYVVRAMDNNYILHLDPEIKQQFFLINLNATALRLHRQAEALKEQVK